MAPTPVELKWRLWDKVLIGDDCWEFQGAQSPKGYGRISRGGKGNGMLNAHVAAYLVWHDMVEVPPGRQINHRCDNPPCCRPDHLYLGTKSENALDAIDRGQLVPHNKLKTECVHGHPFDEENTYYFGEKRYRLCKACNAASNLRRRQTKRDELQAYKEAWRARRRAEGLPPS